MYTVPKFSSEIRYHKVSKFFLTLKFLCFTTEVNTYTDPIKKKRGFSISSSLGFHVEEQPCLTTSQSSYRLPWQSGFQVSTGEEAWAPRSCHRSLCTGHYVFKSKASRSFSVETKSNQHIISTKQLKKKKPYLFSLNKPNFYVFTFKYFTNCHIHGSSFLHPVQEIPHVLHCQTSN